MSKRRSARQNDQRAYKYSCFKPASPPQPPPICNPKTIKITDIATLNQPGTDYLLNGDTTIQSCEILEIGYGNSLVITPYKLINIGTIDNQNGIIANDLNSNGIINKGIINNQNGSILNFSGGIIDNTGGTIDNKAGFFNNNFGGIIDNTGGTIDNTSGGFIYNDGGTIYLGDGTFCPIGTIYNNDGFISSPPLNTCP